MRHRGTDYVAGANGHYKIQPPITHPKFCMCERCLALPADQRVKSHSFRILVRSAFPNDRRASTEYAWDVKRQREAELLAAAAVSYASARRGTTLREVCNLYFEKNPRNVSPATIARDAISANNLCRLITAAPDEIDEPEAVDYRNTRVVELAAPRTILNELSFLKMVLAFGAKWQRDTGMMATKLVTIPDVGESEPAGVALTPEEFRAVLEVVTDVNRARMITGVTTLLRRTPLLAYHRTWTKIDDAWLSVPAEYMKKGRAKRRSPLEVPLSRWAIAQLQGIEPSADGYWWPNPQTGQPLTWVDHIFADAAMRSGVRKFSCHDLRYTGISWLSNAGIDELTIAVLAGHRSSFDASSETTHVRSSNVTRSYAKVFTSTLRAAVAIFDDIRRKVERTALRAVK